MTTKDVNAFMVLTMPRMLNHRQFTLKAFCFCSFGFTYRHHLANVGT